MTDSEHARGGENTDELATTLRRTLHDNGIPLGEIQLWPLANAVTIEQVSPDLAEQITEVLDDHGFQHNYSKTWDRIRVEERQPVPDGGEERATTPEDIALIIAGLFVGDVVKIPERGLKVEVYDSGWPKLAENGAGDEYALHVVESKPRLRSMEDGTEHEIKSMIRMDAAEDAELSTDGGSGVNA